MGGRGASSGGGRSGGGIANATPQQQQKVKNLEKMLSGKGANSPIIRMNANGDVEYQYTLSRVVTKEKGGKMSNPAAADRYERTEFFSGKIKPDGYISQNKTTKEDVLIQKGKR